MNDPMKIAVFVPGLQGGVDEAARHLYGPGTSGRCEVRIYETKGRSAKLAPVVFARTLLLVAWHRVTGQIDGAHINMSFRGSTVRKTIVGWLLIALRVPYVLQIHSGGYGQFWDRLGPRPRALVRSVLRRAERVTVLGEPFRSVAVDRLGVDPDRVLVIPNGVPVSDASSAAGSELAAAAPTVSPPGTSETAPMVLYLGRLHAEKGTYDLIEALSTLTDVGWSATLAGNDEVAQTRAAAAEHQLGNRITVLDWVDRADALQLLDRADVFVLASYEEAMSMSLLEAMGAGLACVATAVGAHVDFLADGENALVIEPGDREQLAGALRTVLTDGSLRTELGERARRTVTDGFERSVVRDTWEQVYRTEFT